MDSCFPSLAKEGFAQQIGEKAQIRNQHSPIANLEHPSALSLAIRRAAKLLIRLIVQGCSKLAIGECWLRIFGPSSSGGFVVQSPLLGKEGNLQGGSAFDSALARWPSGSGRWF